MNKELVNSIIKLLLKCIDELEGVELKDDTMLISTGYMESFDVINLVSELENEFNIEIPLDDIDLEIFDTPASIACLVDKLIKDKE